MLGPRCEGCGSRDVCAASGALRPEYPRCRTPLVGVDIDRMSALFAWHGRASGVHDDGPVAVLERAVLERFSADRLAFSDVLEHSFSCDSKGAHLYRFSYAFPGYRADPGGVAATLLGFCRPFGVHAEQACRTVLRVARAREVTQVLFGFADDGGSRRVKLYIQFDARHPRAARDLAARMLSRPLAAGATSELPLHLLCFDLGERGVAGAKLYYVQDYLRLDDVPSHIGPVALLSALRELGTTELRDVLLIHRIGGRDDAWASGPEEIDFSMPDNDLRWSDVRALPPVRALLEEAPAVAEMTERFRLAMRRLSVTVGETRKLNVYYVLAERRSQAGSTSGDDGGARGGEAPTGARR